MPCYEYKCDTCGGVSDHFMSWQRSQEVEVVCGRCDVVKRKLISAPARTATLWNSGWNSGLNGSGFYSPSVGGMVGNKREEEGIMRSRGYINEKDLGGENFYNDYMTKAKNDRDGLDAMSTTYRDNLKKFDGDKIRAVSETFPAHEMLKQAAEHDAKSGL
jgi:predicted nucleic acid-binding Zn ribbon protein